MPDFGDYKGKKAIIYDENSGDTIAESDILEYSRVTHTIQVDGRRFSRKIDEPVSVLIFGDKSVVEYKGTVRETDILDRLEIALYKGQLKEERAYERYDVHAPAFVENLVIGNLLIPPHERSTVEILNVSSAGVLFRGHSRLLNMGSSFQLRLTLAGSDRVLLNATVVRCIQVGPETAEYGCRLNYQYEA